MSRVSAFGWGRLIVAAAVLLVAVCGVLLALAVDPGGALAVSWAAGVKATLPGGASSTDPGVTLGSVSCASAGNCSAVGSYYDSSSHRQGLLLNEAAGRWKAGVKATLPARANVRPSVRLESVSCASGGDCSAVGTYRDSSNRLEGLLLSERAGRWKAGMKATLPAGANLHPQVTLGSVSCASAGNCSAVGTYIDRSGRLEGLLLSERAGRWKAGVKATLPGGANSTDPDVTLGSVSRASAGNCSAVGDYNASYGRQGLLLSETAGRWKAGVKAISPPDAEYVSAVVLGSVSCTPVGNCSAVGSYNECFGDSCYSHGLLLSETAGRWKTGVTVTLPANGSSGSYDFLGSVSCASTGNCSAVGAYEAYEGSRAGFRQPGLLLSETAGRWKAGVKAILPRGATDAEVWLGPVSCASAGNCSAVGTYLGRSRRVYGLLLSARAGRWQAGVKATLPADANVRPGVHLYSVSCASARNCSAVGTYIDRPGRQQGVLLGTKPA
jgi:hypothetical protein